MSFVNISTFFLVKLIFMELAACFLFKLARVNDVIQRSAALSNSRAGKISRGTHYLEKKNIVGGIYLKKSSSNQ